MFWIRLRGDKQYHAVDNECIEPAMVILCQAAKGCSPYYLAAIDTIIPDVICGDKCPRCYKASMEIRAERQADDA